MEGDSGSPTESSRLHSGVPVANSPPPLSPSESVDMPLKPEMSLDNLSVDPAGTDRIVSDALARGRANIARILRDTDIAPEIRGA